MDEKMFYADESKPHCDFYYDTSLSEHFLSCLECTFSENKNTLSKQKLVLHITRSGF